MTATYYIQTAAMTKPEAMVAGGVMATASTAGRILGSPVLGKVCDYLLEKHKVPRMVFVGLIQIVLFTSLYILTAAVPSPLFLAVLSFLIGALISMFTLSYAAVAEIWSIKTGGALMGLVNTVGQLIGATALALSGFMAARFSVLGGAYNLEYRGIWYLAMIFSALAIFASVFAIYRERKALREREV